MKVGVIGIGAMGKNHVRVYSELDDVELIGVSDLDSEAGARISKRFGCEYYQNYQSLLKEVDAVTVAVPTSHHFQIGKNALENGVHVLMEKPLASTVVEAEELTDVAKDQGLTLATGHIERHNPVVQHTKKLIQEGRMGKILTMSSRRVSNYPSRIRDVGVIMDLAVHDMDISRYLAGSEVRDIFAASGKSGQCEYEDHATIIMKFENGLLGIVDSNWLTPMRVRSMTLTCEKGLIRMDYMAQSLDISTSKLGELDEMNLYQLPLEMETISVGLKKEEPLKRELVDFIQAIEEKRDPLVTAEDGVAVIRMADAALRSSCENSLITF